MFATYLDCLSSPLTLSGYTQHAIQRFTDWFSRSKKQIMKHICLRVCTIDFLLIFNNIKNESFLGLEYFTVDWLKSKKTYSGFPWDVFTHPFPNVAKAGFLGMNELFNLSVLYECKEIYLPWIFCELF